MSPGPIDGPCPSVAEQTRTATASVPARRASRSTGPSRSFRAISCTRTTVASRCHLVILPAKSARYSPGSTNHPPSAALSEPPPALQHVEDHDVAPAGRDHLPVAAAHGSRRPPPILHKPGLAHGVDLAPVDAARAPARA